MTSDPYILSSDQIRDPPRTFRDALKFLGPSFILSASIVGSGELIATTTLGAEAGFVVFWVIIVSCVVKVMVQLEFGKHTILTGETAMQLFNRLPGPRFGKAKWTVWTVLIIMIVKLLQVGGIVGGVAIIITMVIPQLNLTVAALGIAGIVALLVFRGYYRFIERFSILMIAFFTLFTFTSLYFLNFTDYALQWEQVVSGLQFHLPKAAVAVAFGAFGITGVGADEIIHYNYWCLEKGYAAYAGKNDGTMEWEKRAKGWIKVMHTDAVLALICYTLVTAAFYLLGAAVLHAQENVPGGYEMIESLSKMYTEALGPEAKLFFLGGAFIVLFSTLFAALAAWVRQYTDLFGQIGWINFLDPEQRRRSLAVFSWIIPLLWATLYLFIQLPVIMVLSGGIVGSLLLFLVGFATIYFRYQRTDHRFKPLFVYDLMLWISIASISLVGLYGLVRLLN